MGRLAPTQVVIFFLVWLGDDLLGRDIQKFRNGAVHSLVEGDSVVSDSCWKLGSGVAPSPQGHSIMRRGQGRARAVRDRESASHRPGAG